MPEETSLHLLLQAQDQRLGAEQDQLPIGSTGTSSGICHETETCMVRACHTPRQLFRNHPSRHLEGWATPWSAEEMLDGQHQIVDIPAQATTAHNGPCRKDWKNISAESSLLSPRRPSRSRDSYISHTSCAHSSRRTQPASAKLPLCFCLVRRFEEKDSLENVHTVLYCIIKKRST